ncbi:uncharacterized protein PHALS_13580 [Plasmopara halstedii]|uniref:Uncharacterized protein n=1 Tax=Plasmopara halstedii TaxID=4781 RepID=A0A0P1APH7_PLAHL|nr:uncharacterized protein PHALS_13580 [Plasmopara halstedii]CEG43382.1 hypothetical protein PHALS_13580 [Plasmopara halstedii]|eukprot:XP_024579751.1 hypothetical protein PHALS_13580 [Plasmopara halstedii]
MCESPVDRAVFQPEPEVDKKQTTDAGYLQRGYIKSFGFTFGEQKWTCRFKVHTDEDLNSLSMPSNKTLQKDE